jgi:F-type H+-transporting ATPase subunit epsilon
MNLLKFQLVTPERTLLNEELESLSCPTSLGQITILPGHEPLVANLTPGELITTIKGVKSSIHVAGGFVQIKKNSQITVLADAAEHVYEINEQRALAAKEKAEKTLSESKLSDEEYAKVSASLERSLSRINISRKHAHRKLPITAEGVFSE